AIGGDHQRSSSRQLIRDERGHAGKNFAAVHAHCWKCRRAGRGSFHQDKLFCVSLLGETFLTNVDLSKVIGLDTCRHLGPSSIDHRTLEKSPNLPLAFLRGVGLPDGLIDYLPSLLKQAIQFYSCFISYSAKDEDVAERLHADPQRSDFRTIAE